MKKLIALLILASAAFGQTYSQTYGFMFGGVILASTSQQQNAVGNWLAYTKYQRVTKTISKIQVVTNAVAGSPQAGDLELDICASSSSAPGTCASPLATSTTVTTLPTGAQQVVEFTSFTCTVSCVLTAGNLYFPVLRNNNASGTVASNNVSWRYFSSGSYPQGTYGTSVQTSTNSGGAWTKVANSLGIIRYEFTDGSFQGFPIINFGPNAVTGQRIQGTTEYGPTFTMPPNSSVNVIGISIGMLKVGAPGGPAQIKIYSDNGTALTLLATSEGIAATDVDTTGRVVAYYFSTPVTLTGGTVYQVALSDGTSGDTGGNYFNHDDLTVDSNANSLALLPFAGTLRARVCAASCTVSSNWTNSNDIPMFALGFDPAGEFNSTGSGQILGKVTIQ